MRRKGLLDTCSRRGKRVGFKSSVEHSENREDAGTVLIRGFLAQ
jgi:hypothetical protein